MLPLRICNLMGLDSKSSQHGVAITEALHGIDNTEAFYQFLADKKDSITTYGKDEKPERLMTLSRMYKKLQEKAKLPNEKAKTFSEKLTHKVAIVKTFVKNQIELGNPRPFSTIGDTESNEYYFTQKEIRALSELGSSAIIVELSEQYKLEDSLTELFLSKYIAKSKYEALSGGQKRTKHLIENAIKG